MQKFTLLLSSNTIREKFLEHFFYRDCHRNLEDNLKLMISMTQHFERDQYLIGFNEYFHCFGTDL
jgi:hypothetical protein